MATGSSEECHCLECDPCRTLGNTRAASAYCPICEELLCDKCETLHRRNKVLRDHPLDTKLSSTFSRKGSHQVEFCEKHTNVKVSSYCEGHCIVICEICRSFDHTDCKVIGLKEKAKGQVNSAVIKQQLQRIGKITDKLNRLKLQRERDRNVLRQSKASCLTRAVELKRDVENLVNALSGDMPTAVTKTEGKVESKIDNQIFVAVNSLQQLQACKSILDECQTSQDEVVMHLGLLKTDGDVKSTDLIAGKLMRDFATTELHFDPAEELKQLKTELSTFGTVVEKTMSDFLNVTISPEESLDIQPRVKNQEISGSTFTEYGELLICDRTNKKLLLYNKDFTFRSEFQLSSAPYGVSPINGQQVVVTLPEECKIQYMYVRPGMGLDKCVGLDGAPYGICVRNSLIHVYISVRSESYLMVLNLEGKEVKRIKPQEGKLVRRSRALMNCINDITVNRSGDRIFAIFRENMWYVHQKIYDTVICFTEDGKEVFKYSPHEMPSGLYVDDDNNLLVCHTSSNKVHVLTSDGRLHSELLSDKDGLKSPRSLAYRHLDGKLVVVCGSGVCKVFTMKSYTPI